MKVLLVEDSKTTAKQLSQIVEDIPGYEIIDIAVNGAEAIKFYNKYNPDIVFMDIVMPVMNGLQALQSIRQQDSAAKVIIISSLGGVGDKVVEAIRLGAKSVISKPFTAEQIQEALQSL
jgi:two-component system, chemotaxis family, chemotaxis protein CheY